MMIPIWGSLLLQDFPQKKKLNVETTRGPPMQPGVFCFKHVVWQTSRYAQIIAGPPEGSIIFFEG